MSFNYAELASLATTLLTDFGQPVIRRAIGAQVYDPATGVTTSASTDTSRVGAIFDFGAGQTLVRASLIQAGDKRLLVDPDGPVLHTDLFVVGGVTYSIISLGEISPAGTTVLYDLHVRG